MFTCVHVYVCFSYCACKCLYNVLYIPKENEKKPTHLE